MKKKIDWGLNACIGVEINNTWQINFNYSNALGAETSKDDVGINYQIFNLSAAYKFRLK